MSLGCPQSLPQMHYQIAALLAATLVAAAPGVPPVVPTPTMIDAPDVLITAQVITYVVEPIQGSATIGVTRVPGATTFVRTMPVEPPFPPQESIQTVLLGPNTRPLPMPWEKWPFNEEHPFIVDGLKVIKPYSPTGDKLCDKKNCCLLTKWEMLKPKCFFRHWHGLRRTFGKNKEFGDFLHGFYKGFEGDITIWKGWQKGETWREDRLPL
ncbi:hypothetical protein K470DRAFT_171337 [Piedraia hortae CBS 480.64]|uniref:Uncharacterized protein n=1 Tax=Piedraia hortae CBS 480.64 TaxID=1314780 RepID=A0A6A7BSI8_9PEZI|nr:hypothetical protein K470DRAFT_171337 [Piedraia hortae CBS 480.64]